MRHVSSQINKRSETVLMLSASPDRPLYRLARENQRQDEGFTLVEILIVLAILLTISAMAIPSALAAIQTAKNAAAVGDITTMETEISQYEIINNALPPDLSAIGRANFLDPWGNPYQYLDHTTMHGNGKARKDRFLVPLNDDYDLYSMGPDGQSVSPLTAKASQDDIIRASDGAYVGLASQF
jgi:general secretion pathway protein G